MKCCMMQHFIRVCTICLDKNDLQRKKHFYLENITCDPGYIQLTLPSLLYHTRRKNPLVHKGMWGYLDCFYFLSKQSYVDLTHLKYLTETLPMVPTKNVFMEKEEKYHQFWVLFYRYTHYYIKVVYYIQPDAFSINNLH